MKEHVPTIAMLAALALLLLTIIVLASLGQKLESPVIVALAGAASGMGGAIGGFSVNKSPNERALSSGQKEQQT